MVTFLQLVFSNGICLFQQKQAAEADSPMKNEVIGQAHVENYALKVFLYADNEDRAGRFNK